MKSLFYKFHCLGNSFIIIPASDKLDYENVARKLCDKSYGIGADGLIVASSKPYEMLYYNQDGTKATFCGNGIRAYLGYLKQVGYLQKQQTVSVIFNKQIYQCTVVNENPIITKVKIPNINYQIPSLFNQFTSDFTLNEKFNFHQKELSLNLIKVGVLHLVILNQTNYPNEKFLQEAELAELSKLPLFLEQPNIDLVKIINKDEIEVLTYEKGVGYTKSCGSGAVASAAILHLLGYTSQEVLVKYLNNDDEPKEMLVLLNSNEAILYGPTKLICKGECDV